MTPRNIILKNHLSPGDIVMLTAAVRDLHACNPGKFKTDVRTTARELWEHNPHITPLDEGENEVEVLQCHYPLIHRSNQTPFHFVHGFSQFLGEKLGVPVTPTAFNGDIHLSKEEKSQPSQVHQVVGGDLPFWIIVSGGKRDYTIKWWHPERFQAVVDHFKGRILFVQVGEAGHHHLPLNGVLDLRGKTTIRQLVRLVHHSQGVICPVTFLMHLAAAVETRRGTVKCRPCVVVAGGREPVHWEAYPHHRFLHTQGALKCCQSGGCWKARTVPLGDGDPKDQPRNCCVDVVGDLPRCMDMITPRNVIEAVESYFVGGLISYLPKGAAASIDLQAASAKAAPETGPKEASHARRKATPVRNQTTLRVVGLRRSGIHPVQNWLAGLFEGKVCFVNDINHQPRILAAHRSDPLPVLNGTSHRPVRLDEAKRLLILGYEDERLVNLRKFPADERLYGTSEKIRDILILRDPYNTIASRLQLLRLQPLNAFVKDFLLPDEQGVPQLAKRWKFYAHEYLGRTDHLKNQKIVISYNRWVTDPDYRKGLCEVLGVAFRDDHRDRVPAYGFGSSFDRCTFDRRGSAMQWDKRWETFRDDPEYLNLLADPELVELSDTLFPGILDSEFSDRLREKLQALPAPLA